MIPFRSRSDSWTFTLEQRAIGIETNFSRCPIVYEAITEDEAVKELIENGVPESVARSRVGVHRSFSTGAFAEVTSDVQKLLHRAPRSFAEFARDYASAFG